MKKFESVDDVLAFAISEEEAAHAFYSELAEKVDKAWVKQLLLDFAREELGHKAKLEAFKKGKRLQPAARQIMDLQIGDYLVDVDPSQYEVLDYQQALVIAMKKEKAAFKLYSDLAEAAPTEELKNAFLALAQEEAKHKLRFEIEYDDIVLSEN